MATGNRVQGNLIGTDATGTVALGNSIGVFVSGGNNNTIGGTIAGARNVISGNTGEAGLEIYAGLGNLVQGNFIGVDVTGTARLGNFHDGVRVSASENTLIGNVISANFNYGLSILGGNRNVVQGNHIGTDVTGTQPLGNRDIGLYIGGSITTVGGTAEGAGNVIAYNGAFNYQAGVVIVQGTRNALRRNSIFGHSPSLGLRLVQGGNLNRPFPILSSAVTDGDTTTVEGMLTSTPNTTFTLEFFANTVCNASGYGEGERFFASITVATDARGMASFSLTVALAISTDQFITATATDPVGNTSQFSNCVAVTMPNPPVPPPGGGGGMASQDFGRMDAYPNATPSTIPLRSDAFTKPCRFEPYGPERDSRVEYIEAFEVSEYGAPLDAAERARLFPFPPTSSTSGSAFVRKEWVDIPEEE
jgi:parallel beta-helix repeat protein